LIDEASINFLNISIFVDKSLKIVKAKGFFDASDTPISNNGFCAIFAHKSMKINHYMV